VQSSPTALAVSSHDVKQQIVNFVLFKYSRKLISSTLVLWLGCSLICRATDLNGTILDDKGKPVAGAMVTIHRSSVDGPLRATETYTQTSAKDGTYSLQGLSAGAFTICAVVPSRSLLDPCKWNDSPPIVRIAANAKVVTATTQLELGATVSVRVSDPQLALAVVPPGTSGGRVIAPIVVMGVWTSNGHFHPAWEVSSDSGGKDLTLIVPAGVDLKFAVSGKDVFVKDSLNAPVDSSKRSTLRLTPGETLRLNYSLGKQP
jgi:hypothetical protein